MESSCDCLVPCVTFDDEEEQQLDQKLLSFQKQLRLQHKEQQDQLFLSFLQELPQEARQPITEPPLPSLDGVERIIGYSFRNRALLRQAFTHGSVSALDSGSASYERLEYVGDSVLNLLIAREDYFVYPDLAPGKLTRLRAANVDTEKLARVAVRHGLHKYLRHRKPMLDGQIREFMDAIEEYPLHSTGLIDAPKVLADIVESTIGAIFIDSNSSMDTTWKVVKSLLEPIITPKTIQTHPVTKLYELCQKNGFKLRFVDVWEKTGNVEVFVDNKFVERGTYRPKKLIALNRAANNAYDKIVRELSAQENTNDHW